jgi:anti-sigma factor RsiW
MVSETCRALCLELSEYVDGKASAETCADIERHISGCADCRIVVDTLRRTISLYRRIPREEMPAGAREQLYRTLHLDDLLPPRT